MCVCVRVCVCAVPGVPFQQDVMVQQSTVRLEGLLLGRVVPLFLVAAHSYAEQFLRPGPLPCVPWLSVFSSVPQASQIPDGLSGFRVVTLNCGGATDKHHVIVGVVLSHDPHVVFLQELWDTDVSVLIPLRMYYCCASRLQVRAGAWRCFSIGMWRYGVQPSVSVLLDVRSCFVVLAYHEGSAVLYGDIHFDPELNSTGKEEVLTRLGTVIRQIRPHHVVVAGDFNVPRSEYCLVSRVLGPGHILSGLNIPYAAGTMTNYTKQRTGPRSTKIDYILVSSGLSLSSNSVYPGVSTHMLVLCDFAGFGQRSGAYIKRYRHRSTTTDMRSQLSAQLGIYWWWLSRTPSYPDV